MLAITHGEKYIANGNELPKEIAGKDAPLGKLKRINIIIDGKISEKCVYQVNGMNYMQIKDFMDGDPDDSDFIFYCMSTEE